MTSDLLVYTVDGYIRKRPISSLPIPVPTHIIEIKFTVGDMDYPQHGDTEYTPLAVDFSPILAGKKVLVFREGDTEFADDTSKGITFNSTLGTIYFYPDLNEGEDIRIWAFADTTIQEYVPGGGSSLLIGPGIALSIDGNDNLLI